MPETRDALPTGIVAFLFSDVEASTRRWEQYGEAMRDALRRHDEIVRNAIEARRGYVFKTIGDAFCAAFSSAADALEAATDAQRRLEGEDFRAVDGLRVRMAIHAGETDERAGDYFGSAVNRTARLLSAAHGGQVVLSAYAAELAFEKLPDGITLRNLGTVPLRGIKEPERVYQAVGFGLRSEAKPLRALETPPNNLPRQSTSFVGRNDDLARVEALLDEGSVVTLVGAGGIGKTRLALEVAASRLNDERDGVWLADLSAVGDPELIASTILSAVGAELSHDRDPLNDLIGYLQGRQLLLVLDNSEHLVADVAPIVAHLVEQCPHLTVLATSRSPLDISCERIYRLATLDAVSAVRLFADRAQAANPAFRVEPKLAAVEAICGRLDGIALAIELAAARVRTMSVENLASHLELRLLTGGRDRRPRQQTMRALIGWSYELLSGDERRVLRRAAVFLKGFTLGLAAQVCGAESEDEWRIFDLLTSLADKSLVVVDVEEADQRYRLLEPIREYGWDELVEAGELADARRRHAGAFAAFAAAAYEEWEAGPGDDWLARVERELANLRAALRWSLEEKNDTALGAQLVAAATIVFLRLGLLSEGIEWYERTTASCAGLPSGVEARLRYGLSMLYSNVGADDRCLEEASRAVELYRRNGDERGLARSLSQVASRHAFASRNREAKAAAQEALALARIADDRRLLADVLRRCAESFGDEGHDAVRARYEESVAVFRSLGRDDDTSRALQWWGQWENNIGDHLNAAQRLLEAAQLTDRDTALVFLTNDIASAYLAAGDRTRAEPFARRALTLATKAGHDVLAALAISYLAVIASEKKPQAGARLIGYAEQRLRIFGWELLPPDPATIARLHELLRRELPESELAILFAEGADWSEERGFTEAFSS
ncbi:MAG TPA: adenylate/guanylate cyclase domain-containing protein [Candidatus Cybelea sp.]|nr:adenylate/guanylate cyclase domain-containing protein [Candidatus Cybelea sp.]